ncbi:F-box domain containing protein, partial [Tanacetum coccineum]
VIITGVGTTLQLQGGRRGTNSRDFISGMPDDILIMILSLLPVKDAIVTSILSTRWRFLWSFSTNLNFDGTENLINMVIWSGKEPKYINHVNNVIQSYKHPIVKDFRIRMPLRGHHMGVIDEWLQFAVNKKVEFLELGKHQSACESGQNYNFPSRLFETKIFRSPSSSNALWTYFL